MKDADLMALTVIGFGGFYEAIKNSADFGTVAGVGKQSVFTANYKRVDRTLSAIAVDSS